MALETDFLVIGSGLAGLTYALRVAEQGSVALVTKKKRTDANSSWAQGGIAGVVSEDDSFELHKQDTLIAGAGLCNVEAVEVLVREGPERIRELIRLGAGFNMETDPAGHEVLSLGREGGHSRNRIVHTADYTGWECERTLLEAVRSCPNIKVYEHYFVTDLLISNNPGARECLGGLALNPDTGEVQKFRAKATLLATGGCGQVYLHTTNPTVATGDGVAMAWRAGAKIANMEFIQFHPTTLYHPDARGFLITEALRGEGGILQHEDGERFMERYDPRLELAPRDIVSRAIVSELKRRNVPCVFLDVTRLDLDFLRAHFPTVYERCQTVGIDISKQPIPIVPAQHYQCGGVITDLDGATNIARLYAAGEVACTGVHGANRLASNSLLEAMVFGDRAARSAMSLVPSVTVNDPTLATASVPQMLVKNTSNAEVDLLADRVRLVMQKYVGIVRSTLELEQVDAELKHIGERLSKIPDYGVGALEAANLRLVANLIVTSALKRHESRGLHYTVDFPLPLESERHDTVLSP